MRNKLSTVTLLVLFILAFATTPARALLYIGSSGSLSASADFSIVGGNLQVILTNTSSADVLNPADVLTALFFDIVGVGPLTPDSALLNGSTVFFGLDGGGNVGGEWAYKAGLAGAPGSATEGISSTGLGLFGPLDNFPGANLGGPVEVNGGNYGITSLGDNLANGNAAVTGGEPLIWNAVTFTLSGIPYGFLPSSTNITHVSFQYGTALSGSDGSPPPPNIPGEPSTGIPEPSSMLLIGSGLLLLVKSTRRIGN